MSRYLRRQSVVIPTSVPALGDTESDSGRSAPEPRDCNLGNKRCLEEGKKPPRGATNNERSPHRKEVGRSKKRLTSNDDPLKRPFPDDSPSYLQVLALRSISMRKNESLVVEAPLPDVFSRSTCGRNNNGSSRLALAVGSASSCGTGAGGRPYVPCSHTRLGIICCP